MPCIGHSPHISAHWQIWASEMTGYIHSGLSNKSNNEESPSDPFWDYESFILFYFTLQSKTLEIEYP